MSVPTPPSNVTERVKATETAAERAVREGRASSFDLTDPANPKVKGQDGQWHDAK